ncbi:MAG: ATPase, T2SS/T4P/T4SS family [bacterium]
MTAPVAAERRGDPLGEILVSRKLLEPDALAKHQARAERERSSLESVLLRTGVFSRGQLLQVLENFFFCPSADVTRQEYAAGAVAKLPRALAERYEALPLGFDGERLVVAFADPSNDKALEQLSTAVRAPVLPRVALRIDLLDVIRSTYDRFAEEAAAAAPVNTVPARSAQPRSVALPPSPPRSVTPGPSAPPGSFAPPDASAAPTIVPEKAKVSIDLSTREAPVIVQRLFEAAARNDATDIHIHPDKEGLDVRLRIDGILHSVAKLPKELVAPVIARIKVLSRLDIAEHRIPQDGRQSVEIDGGLIDLRVSTLPSQFGENVVLRLLRKDMSLLNLDRLQMPAAIREAHQDAVASPVGFFLVTGPTGSGKTTTLYATLASLDRVATNIVTLEDPIEYSFPGITQVQIQEDAGLSFASGLRSILRQDPDVVLVGEIRDLETVEIACRAALTGHKVLSTIHTNDACQAITRLMDMGTPAHLITATLRGVLAQRLVRVICKECKEAYEPNETERAILGYPKEAHVHRGRGCPSCAHTGYKGRLAIFEYFKVEESMHRLILDHASPFAIRHAAQRNGMILMADFAKRAVLDGTTTVAEIQRVVLSSERREQLCDGCGRVVGIDFAVCPFCQHVLKESCAGCGTAIDPSWEACPTCGRTVERQWQKVFCRSCLAPVDASWTTCRYCGEALS